MIGGVEAVLDLARRFGPIWPQSPQKTGYAGTRGARDATLDEMIIRAWWSAHPDAVPALLTGEASGVVALDIDIKNGRNGLDTLEALGVVFHPATPTAHTPSGGLHCLFAWPGRFVPTSIDKLGPGIEVKGDRGWITLPPGPGRSWDPVLGPETPLAEMPGWMVLPEPAAPKAPAAPARPRVGSLTRYAEAALDDAVKAIASAPQGEQHATLNREVFAIAGLVAGGYIPSALALDALRWAALKMPSHDPRRPWRAADVERQVRAAFVDGLSRPREAPAA